MTESILLTRINKFLSDVSTGTYFEKLSGRPRPHIYREPPRLVHCATYNTPSPLFTVVTPTFENGHKICDQLISVSDCSTLPFDWIIIDDGSTDETLRYAMEYLAQPLGRVCDLIILYNPVPIFETACDNFGFFLSRTEYIIEIQADIFVDETGFDSALIRRLLDPSKPAAASGRCGHLFDWISIGETKSNELHGRVGGVGLTGLKITNPSIVDDLRGHSYLVETVNRGPWAVRRSDLERYQFLDEANFFLGNDDHDYHRRIWQAEQRVSVYVPMSLRSPLHLGATRRPRSGCNAKVYELLCNARKGSDAFFEFLEGYNPHQFPTRAL